MNCPLDQARMRPLTDKGIVFDWCDLCDGIWLDAGELTHLTQTATDLPELPPPPARTGSSRETGRPAHASRSGSFAHPHCPRCNLSMEELPYAEGETFLVDRCPRCRGLWLERGELQTIYDHVVKRRKSPPPAEGISIKQAPPVQADRLALTVFLGLAGFLLVVALATVLVFLTRR